jgi:deoxyadenosine/deoxycytidine kinase
MGRLVAVVGPSGVGKTTFVQALSRAGHFEVAYEEHGGRPFQALFQQDKRFGFANQIDYLLLRAEQEKKLRAAPLTGLTDGGLDLDFRGFARLFLARGWLTSSEFDLCRRLYEMTRGLLPAPELVIALRADEGLIRQRLAARSRINIASAEDTAAFNAFLEEWLSTLPESGLLRLDVSGESIQFDQSLPAVLGRL